MARIILIEDDIAVLSVLQRYLAGVGHDVVGFAEPEVARDWLIHNPVDLIIIDERLPRLTGTQVLESVRLTAVCTNVPAIRISGLPVETALTAGDMMLLKPFEPEALQRLCDKILRYRRPELTCP